MVPSVPIRLAQASLSPPHGHERAGSDQRMNGPRFGSAWTNRTKKHGVGPIYPWLKPWLKPSSLGSSLGSSSRANGPMEASLWNVKRSTKSHYIYNVSIQIAFLLKIENFDSNCIIIENRKFVFNMNDI